MNDWMPEPDTTPGTALPGAPAPGAPAPVSGPDGPVPGAEAPTPSHDPVPPAPLGIPRAPTGHPGVDARLERLADADHLPADGHTEVYEDVHRGLRDELSALDAPPTTRTDAQ
ncbi:hypothetical protein OG909_05300 [Streptomyces sp. NBC_01754]|uniref:hypothetical protein n=1 Tax=Streptomyces sp. NBC_01754 TaxID=2975930 RepID=UPI002DDB4D98|nr:hypothetical protein [Streptomyces sp. NBC_01754]WSC91751.1 hypothetical protein OG909_05300 [Streptomyces sp. NBC_01754]